MPPNNLTQNQPGEPTSLPPIAAVAMQSQQSTSNPPYPQHPVGTVDITGRVVAEAERLAGQYANDPYRLSEALGQLKAAYLAQKYNLDLNNQSMER